MIWWYKEAKVVGPPELTDLKIPWAMKAEPVPSKQTLKTEKELPWKRSHTFGQESNIPLVHKCFLSTFGFSYILKINIQLHYKTEKTVEAQSVPLK